MSNYLIVGFKRKVFFLYFIGEVIIFKFDLRMCFRDLMMICEICVL